MKYNFTNISDLQNVQKDSTVDAIGILQDAGECSEIIGKASGTPYNKRELTLVDDTGFSVRLTIWGKTAQSFNETPETVLAFKGLKVSDFGGRSLSLLSSGNMTTDPDIDEAHKLKGWYDAQGRSEHYTSHASLMQNPTAGTGSKYQAKTIAEIKDENIGMSEEAQYFNLKATVVFIKDNTGFAYPACSNPGPPQCNKKVTEIDPGQWQCEKCDRAWPKPQWRYVLAVNVQDHTGQAWLNCFDDTGRIVIGATADEMMDLKDNDERKFGDRLHEANCKTWMFRCRARMDNFQDQTRVRYQVVNASPVDWAREAKGLVEQLKLYDAAPPRDDGMFVN